MEEFELNRLGKMSHAAGKPEDLFACGSLEFFDKTNDKINTKTQQPLPKTDRVYSNVTTTDDPHIREVGVRLPISRCLIPVRSWRGLARQGSLRRMPFWPRS